MDSLTVANIDETISKLRMMKSLLKEICPELELLQKLNCRRIVLPVLSDRLVRAGQAAQILGVAKETIYDYVHRGMLTPYYTDGSAHMKFWLADVKQLAVKG